MNFFEPTAGELKKYLIKDLLPVWRDKGWDRERGGFYNALNLDQTPVAQDYKRLLVQTRMVYTYSHAYLVFREPWCLEMAQSTYDYLVDRFHDERRGGWFQTVSLSGDAVSRKKMSYDHAFVLFALAYYYRATSDPNALKLAEITFDLMERHLWDPSHGGFFEGARENWDLVAADRRQNPHMHLLEALLALFDATGNERYLRAAEKIMELFENKFFDSESGRLYEHFGQDWNRKPLGREPVLEPGHHFEWYWLISQFAKRTDFSRGQVLQDSLFGFAQSFGVDASDGCVYDQISPEGTLIQGSKRLWPQLERIKALALRFSTVQDSQSKGELFKALEILGTKFLNPQKMTWNERLSQEGRSIQPDMPATSVYHIFLGLIEAAAALEKT